MEKSEVIDNFYKIISEFVKKYVENINKDYSDDSELEKIIRNIPTIIKGFEDPKTEEEYRMLAKKQDGTLATIQITDPETHYKLYKPISSNEYKNVYYECLMYCLVYYEMFFNNWKYEIAGENSSKQGTFQITEKQLPHLLGIDSKLIGQSEIINSIIPDYNNKSPIEQLLLIIRDYDKIKQYEKKNNVEIINYYKSMQKLKNFLLLGRLFNEFRATSPSQFKLGIVDKTDSSNQLYLYKVSNMNSSMQRNVIKMIIQLTADGTFFPKSLQSISKDIDAIEKAKFDLRNENIILKDLPPDIQGILKSENLLLTGKIEFTPSTLTTNETIELKENESMINPWIFTHDEVSAGVVKAEELYAFLDFLKNNEERDFEI